MLARSRLMVISSRMEGGANVVSEALALGVPVIASRVSGNVGMLGGHYGGYYPAGDERSLARLLWRAESDERFYRALRVQCRARRHLVSVSRERASLRRLLAELPANRKSSQGAKTTRTTIEPLRPPGASRESSKAVGRRGAKRGD